MENDKRKKVLVLGSRGMLGQELVKAFSFDEKYFVIGLDREEIDVTDLSDMEPKICAIAPDIIFNTAAYNAVDLCEENDEEYAKALKLNAEAPALLSRVAMSQGAIFVHYSTDYVFGQGEILNPSHPPTGGGGQDDKERGFSEQDVPQPNCRYAESKFKGEMAVRTIGGKYYLIRLSKLFGKPAASAQGKKSFFETMLVLGQTKDEVKAVDGEMSCFTYAPDLAQASKELVESRSLHGVYHFVNEGAATWYEGVKELYKQAGLQTKVVPVGSDEFPRPAKRPEFSVLLNTRRPKLRPWQEALKDFLTQE